METTFPQSALVECVPNFSEGRDLATVQAIAAAAAAVPGILLLDLQRDIDHNRSVLTMAGPPAAIAEAAVAAAGVAAARIDLRGHLGVHPRIGAADVVPFIPLRDVSLDQCAELAREAGREYWRRNGVPVYFYEAAALRAGRTRLEQIRKGGFRVLREISATDPARTPDVGGPALHPSAGASVFGARNFLVAYNVNLKTDDVGLARRIAREIRASLGRISGGEGARRIPRKPRPGAGDHERHRLRRHARPHRVPGDRARRGARRRCDRGLGVDRADSARVPRTRRRLRFPLGALGRFDGAGDAARTGSRGLDELAAGNSGSRFLNWLSRGAVFLTRRWSGITWDSRSSLHNRNSGHW